MISRRAQCSTLVVSLRSFSLCERGGGGVSELFARVCACASAYTYVLTQMGMEARLHKHTHTHTHTQ